MSACILILWMFCRCALLYVYAGFPALLGLSAVFLKKQHRTDSSAAGVSENLRWNFETRLKRWESDVHSIVEVDGAVCLIRRAHYPHVQAVEMYCPAVLSAGDVRRLSCWLLARPIGQPIGNVETTIRVIPCAA